MNPGLHHLSHVMVAPNGARLTQADHPAIPLSVTEVVETVALAADEGAEAVHLHVRDEQHRHVLDANLYRQSIEAVRQSQGRDFPIQITTEAVGRYSQAEQISVVQSLEPEFVSVALAEMAGEDALLDEANRFYHWCDSAQVNVQHILYSPDDLERFVKLKHSGVIPSSHNAVLFVLGRYAVNQLSDTAMLDAFLAVKQVVDRPSQLNWMICAFGQTETECLVYAASLGGHVRVGFENNLLNEDGTRAANNAERVRQVCSKINSLPEVPDGNVKTGSMQKGAMSNDALRQILGQPA